VVGDDCFSFPIRMFDRTIKKMTGLDVVEEIMRKGESQTSSRYGEVLRGEWGEHL
jgi:hypothetical protein